MAAVHAVKLARGFELLGRELANGLQHAEAAVGGASGEALLDEPVERVDVAAAHLLCGFDREAAAEDCEPREEPLLMGRRSS